jgi:hypothetical protein
MTTDQETVFYHAINRDYVSGKRQKPMVDVPFSLAPNETFGGLSMILGAIGLMILLAVTVGAFQRPIDTAEAQILSRDAQTVTLQFTAPVDRVRHTPTITVNANQAASLDGVNSTRIAFNRFQPSQPSFNLDYNGGPFAVQSWTSSTAILLGLVTLIALILISLPIREIPRTRRKNIEAATNQVAQKTRLVNDGQVIYGTLQDIIPQFDALGDVVGYGLQYAFQSPTTQQTVSGHMAVTKKDIGDEDAYQWEGRQIVVLYADDDLHQML